MEWNFCFPIVIRIYKWWIHKREKNGCGSDSIFECNAMKEIDYFYASVAYALSSAVRPSFSPTADLLAHWIQVRVSCGNGVRAPIYSMTWIIMLAQRDSFIISADSLLYFMRDNFMLNSMRKHSKSSFLLFLKKSLWRDTLPLYSRKFSIFIYFQMMTAMLTKWLIIWTAIQMPKMAAIGRGHVVM